MLHFANDEDHDDEGEEDEYTIKGVPKKVIFIMLLDWSTAGQLLVKSLFFSSSTATLQIHVALCRW